MSSTDDRHHTLLESIATALMAVATIATAWCAYQSTLWSGEEEFQLHTADELSREALALRSQGMQMTMLDVHLFTNYVNAYSMQKVRLQEFYRDRFSPRLRPAFDAWMVAWTRDSLSAPRHPFEMKEYVVPQALKADSLERRHRDEVTSARASNNRSEDYVLLTVIYASILFFGGITSNINALATKRILVIGSTLLLLASVVWMLTFPLAP